MTWDVERDWDAVVRDEVPGPAALYAETRGRCPVVRAPGVFGGIWAVLGHDDVRDAALSPADFGNVVPLFDVRRPPLESDPPEHKHYRRMLNRYFLPDRMSVFEPNLRAIATSLLAPLVEAGGGDFVAGFSHPFPARALCGLMRIPDADWEILVRWATKVDEIGGTSAPGDPARAAVGEELVPYMRALIADRRGDPGDDIVSGMVTGEIDGRALTDDEVLGLVMMLLSAGHNTTRSGLGNILLRLARDQELQELLRQSPDLIPAVVEESLRLDAPQQAMRRVARRDVELGGQRIREGEHVWLVFGAANLDGAQWPDADRLDIDRAATRHMAFGRGIHQCLGAPLARLEMRIAVQELLAASLSFRVAGEVVRPEWPRLGVTRLPLAIAGRSAGR